MRHTLQRFGFCGPILSAILALYSSSCAQVFTSYLLSDSFNISNGTRQGCPLSPSIFNLLIEPLAERVRTHPNISGFSIQGQSHNINLFADDIILFLSSPDISLLHAHDTLNEFSKISYYKVNFTKSIILDFGITPSLKSQLLTSYPYTWSNSSITYLGLTLTKNPQDLAEANYPALITKLSKETKRMANTELTWTGRLASFKMLILPQILCVSYPTGPNTQHVHQSTKHPTL